MVTVLNLDSCSHNIMDFSKKRSAFAPKEQDPMSHRIIEKRRRDRMNNCLADLSRLIPPDYLKKGRGRIEKTEIIEMAIKHLKYLQERASLAERRGSTPISAEHFRLGYQECLSEVMRYLVEGQAHFPGDAICVQLINHLQRHCDNIMKGDVLNKPRSNPDSNSSSSGSSSNYMFHNQLPASNNMQRMSRKSIDINSEEKSRLSYEIEHSRRTSESIDDSPKENSNEEQDYNNQIMSPKSLSSGNGYSVISPMEDNNDKSGGRNRSEFLKKSMQEIVDIPKSDNQPIQNINMFNHMPVLPPNYHYGAHHPHCNIQKMDGTLLDDSGLSLGSGQEIDNMHSYKFKNNIKQRFSQSQSTDYTSSSQNDGMVNIYNRNEIPLTKWEQFNLNGKLNHKKRKMESRHFNNSYNNQYTDQMSTSETNSSENITTISQNTNYRSNMIKEPNMSNRQSVDKDYSKFRHSIMHNRHGKTYNTNEKVEAYTNTSGLGVPIFALHAKGTFYVPMNVHYDCLIPYLGQYDLLETTTLQANSSLHPVTISVNFQPKLFNNKQSLNQGKTECK